MAALAGPLPGDLVLQQLRGVPGAAHAGALAQSRRRQARAGAYAERVGPGRRAYARRDTRELSERRWHGHRAAGAAALHGRPRQTNSVGVRTMATAELSQSLKPRHLTMISIGGIIGAGLFVGSSVSIAAIGPAIVVSYLITGTLILLVMRMLGEMAMSLPDVHSFADFPRAGLGPWAGFMTGWLYWYFWMIVVPFEAIAGANILQHYIPLSAGVLGCLLMACMTAVNLMSTRSYGEFEFWFSSIKVAAIIAFIALGASYAFGWTSPHGASVANLTGHGGFMPHGTVAVLAGAVTVFFQLTGAEIITVAAVESAEPARAVAQLTSSIIVRVLTFYVGSIFIIVAVVPWNSIEIGTSPFTQALLQMHFTWAKTVMDFIVLTAVLSCLNSAFYVCSRVLFGLAGHGDAPQA